MSKKYTQGTERLPFRCHSECAVICDNRHKGKHIQGCPVCGREHIVDFDNRTIDYLKTGSSLEKDRLLIHAIYSSLNCDNNLEIKLNADGGLKIYIVTKKLVNI